jgi:hypothetical protein
MRRAPFVVALDAAELPEALRLARCSTGFFLLFATSWICRFKARLLLGGGRTITNVYSSTVDQRR